MGAFCQWNKTISCAWYNSHCTVTNASGVLLFGNNCKYCDICYLWVFWPITKIELMILIIPI